METELSIKPGEVYKVWSERVFGVPVHFTVTKIGRTMVHGTAYYGMDEWPMKIRLAFWNDRVVSQVS
jgi:hypothetical protein